MFYHMSGKKNRNNQSQLANIKCVLEIISQLHTEKKWCVELTQVYFITWLGKLK